MYSSCGILEVNGTRQRIAQKISIMSPSLSPFLLLLLLLPTDGVASVVEGGRKRDRERVCVELVLLVVFVLRMYSSCGTLEVNAAKRGYHFYL
jgi:hypothetical protein